MTVTLRILPRKSESSFSSPKVQRSCVSIRTWIRSNSKCGPRLQCQKCIFGSFVAYDHLVLEASSCVAHDNSRRRGEHCILQSPHTLLNIIEEISSYSPVVP